jgi:mono/diheme cytochrome c family protein
MPIPEERLYKPDRLNRWFAVSSILMTASILWMIEVDYDRPWCGFQDRYFVGKAALAHLDYLDASRQEHVNEIAEAERRLADARELVARTEAGKRTEVGASLDEADLEFKKSNAPWSMASQVLEVTKDDYERALGQYGADHPITQGAHKQFVAEEEHVEELRKVKEKWEDKKKQLESELREIDRSVRAAQKLLDDLRQVAEAAKQKDMQFRGVLTDSGLLAGLPIVRWVINAPLGDFTAPKNTPGRHQVNQLVLPDVRQRLNYLESYTTDRCTTCHIAIDDPEFSKDRLAQKLERSIPGISEAMQRMGLSPIDPPAPPALASGSVVLTAGRVTERWKDLAQKQQDEYFEALLRLVNNYLKAGGRKPLELGQPILAHPNLDLYLTPDSAHPMSKMGCTVCHEGNPQETDFVQAAHTPPTHKIEEIWKDKYYITLMGIPNITFETIAHYWDRPMRLPEYTESGCAKCHSEVTDIARFHGERHGSRINLGQQLFREVGCINCHNVDAMAGSRRVGPDLRNIRAKLTPSFVQQWVYFPQDFRPSTRMPHFFMQENNREESVNRFDPDPKLRTQTEVAAMTKYLFAVSNDWKPTLKQEDVTGNVDRGRQLFRSAGCLACHSNLGEFGEEWITKDLVQREGISEETALFRYKGMTQDQRAHYAMEHFVEHHETFLEPEMATFDPEKPYNVPIFSRYAPELSGVGSKVSFDWLYSWLIEPKDYAPDTKMPSMRLTPSEAADIATYLMTQRNDEFKQGEFPMDAAAKKMADDLILQLLSAQRSERRSLAIMNDEGGELTDMLAAGLKGRNAGDAEAAHKLVSPMTLEDKKMMYLGSKMIGHYGCYACHYIRGFEETTPPGTELSTWAEKPVTQLDFAFYDNAFEKMREEKEDIFGPIYPRDAKGLRYLSPLPDDAHEEITHTHAAFAKHKMLNPRIWDREKIKRPYDKLKMPNFYFTENESKALTTFLLSRIPPRVSGSLVVDYETELNGPVAKGRTLTRELNCVACHQIEDNAPTIQQHFRRKTSSGLVFDVTNAPPLLWGEGAKVQHHWFHGFLQNVIPLRPWLAVRMPSFYLTNEQATTLVEYFAALSQKDSGMVAKALAPVDEYVQTAKPAKLTGEKETDKKETPPGADWYARASLGRSAEELRDWAVNRKLIRPNELDPFTSPPERVRAAHADLLERVRFLKDLYNVEYPFAEPPVTLHSDDHYKLGESFLVDMGCLKCHVLGNMAPGPPHNTDEFVQAYRLDAVRGEGEEAVAVLNGNPYRVGSDIDGHKLVSATNTFYDSGDVETKAIVEGPGPDGKTERVMLVAASAPNLVLAHLRLQRTWLFNWMLNPQLIQPGTKMPMNFPSGVSPFNDDAKYAGNKDHIGLLVDFLYDAGTKNDRVPLPKLPAPSESEEFNEGGGGAFEE